MIFETKGCAGCRTCEIACSFHHKGVFRPSISSIEIIDKPKELGFAILIHDRASNGHLACDRCKGLDEPLCVKYCVMRQELKAILGSHFIEK